MVKNFGRSNKRGSKKRKNKAHGTKKSDQKFSQDKRANSEIRSEDPKDNTNVLQSTSVQSENITEHIDVNSIAQELIEFVTSSLESKGVIRMKPTSLKFEAFDANDLKLMRKESVEFVEPSLEEIGAIIKKTTLSKSGTDDANDLKSMIKEPVEFVKPSLEGIGAIRKKITSSKSGTDDANDSKSITKEPVEFVKPSLEGTGAIRKKTNLLKSETDDAHELILEIKFNPTTKDLLETAAKITEFMEPIERTLQDMSDSMTNLRKEFICVVYYTVRQGAVTKIGKSKKQQLIPLRGGLQQIFPIITVPTQIQYVNYINPIMTTLIKGINLIMKKFLLSQTSFFHFMIRSLNQIFGVHIGNNNVFTYDMLVKIYDDILNLVMPNIIIGIINEFQTCPFEVDASVEQILTEDELRFVNCDVESALNRYGPFVIADFIESPYVKNLLSNKLRISMDEMYYYFINRDVMKMLNIKLW